MFYGLRSEINVDDDDDDDDDTDLHVTNAYHSGRVLLNGQTREGGSGRSFHLRPTKKNGQIGSDRVWPVNKNSTSV